MRRTGRFTSVIPDRASGRTRAMVRPAGIAGSAACLAVMVGVLAGGCVGSGGGQAASTSPRLPLAAGEYALPEIPMGANGLPLGACAGVAFDKRVVIHGAAEDPALAWIVFPDGTRVNLVWPLGFRARFVPKLEVLNASGRVVARDGDLATGGCGMGPNSALIDAANDNPNPPPYPSR
jgi:hypothetical protein